MCLAKLYESADSEPAVLTDIAHIRCRPDRVEVETLLGERKVIQGTISHIDFVKSRVILTK